MFLPSGRVHAIGAGNVILEIQQNSDTTYRVDDWGRVDDQGRPRTLHREQALASIRFNDFEPQFVQPHGERVLQCPFFTVERAFIYPGEYRVWNSDQTSFQYHFLAQGELKIEDRDAQARRQLARPRQRRELQPRAARRRRGTGHGAVGEVAAGIRRQRLCLTARSLFF